MKWLVAALVLTFSFVGSVSAVEFDDVFGEEIEVIFDEDVFTGALSNAEFSRDYPVMSPDGKWIAFVGSVGSLLIVPADGGEAVLLDECFLDMPIETSEIFETGGFQFLNFTPDSRKIIYQTHVFDSERGSTVTDFWGGTQISNIIHVINSIDIYSGEKKTVIDGGREPSLSPDGRYITYLNFDWRVYTDELQAEHHMAPAIYDMVTGESWILTDYHSGSYDPDGYIQPSFSPGMSHVVVGFNHQLCKIPFDGGEPEYLTDFSGTGSINIINPRYSPDSRWILFCAGWNLMVFDTETDKAFWLFAEEEYVPLTPSPYKFKSKSGLSGIGRQGRAAWSPDGESILYSISKEMLIDNDSPFEPHAGVGTTLYIADFDPDFYDREKNSPTFVDSDLPAGFGIAGNYPNPFNPTTTVKFSLAESGFTTLSVYNVSGQKVRELVAGEMSRGQHSVSWDGRNAAGAKVSSGVYIVRLRSGSCVTAKQMMLTK